MDFLTHLDSFWKIAGSIVASITAVAVCFKKVRDRIVWVFRVAHHHWTIGDAVMKKLESLDMRMQSTEMLQENRFLEVKRDITYLREQSSFNGGSTLRDAVTRVEAHRAFDFISRPAPAFECTNTGNMLLVSEAFCRLVDVHSDVHLKGHSWQSFVDTDDIDDLAQIMDQALKTGSIVRAKARWCDMQGSPLGQWELKAFPVGHTDSLLRYVGKLYPVDDTAKQVAARLTFVY